MRPLSVFIVCSGLGNVNRGYETFYRQFFDVIKGDRRFSLTLLKGGGSACQDEVVVWNLPRVHPFTIQVARVVGRLWGNGGAYFTEQLSFFLGMLPHLAFNRPDVIYFSDESMGKFLRIWKKYSKSSSQLVFRNGGPTVDFELLNHWDRVHQLSKSHYLNSIEHGVATDHQYIVPNSIEISKEFSCLSQREKEKSAEQLGLPLDRKIVLSVAAINASHKRIDYLIREVSQLKEPRPFLVMLGQQNQQSHEIIHLAEDLLGEGNFLVKTVPPQDVTHYYQVAHVFVLSSLREGFARVLAEALTYGLPCLAHDYGVNRDVLEQYGFYADFTQAGTLAALLVKVLAQDEQLSDKQQRYQFAYENYSWDRLTERYAEMLLDSVASPVSVAEKSTKLEFNKEALSSHG